MGRPKSHYVAASALVLASAAACTRRAAVEEPPGLVARFGEVAFTAADVDRRIVSLPPDKRPGIGEDLGAWYRSQIREMAVDDRLRREALAAGLPEEQEFLDARRDAERNLAIQLCLDALRPRIEKIPEEDLAARFAASADELATPERRNVYHLFVRHLPGEEMAETRKRIEALRDRVMAGESFLRLAREYSDSETRHADGALGWLTPGELPRGLEDAAFSLEEGLPSEPIELNDGFHLLYVAAILPEHQATLDEVRGELEASMYRERLEAAFDEVAASVAVPEGAVVLTREELDEIVAAGDVEATVLEIADRHLTLADLGVSARNAATRSGTRARSGVDALWSNLEALRRAELLFYRCRREKLVASSELDDRLASWTDRALVAMQRRRRLRERAETRGDALRQYYESNIGRFSDPPEWHVRLLRIALGTDAAGVMADLERASAGSEDGLEVLSERYDGEIEDLGSRTLQSLAQVSAKLPPLVAPLKPGELSAPYRTEDSLEIAEVLAVVAARSRPFEEVRDQVVSAYVAQNAQELYRKLADEILASVPLEISSDALETLRSVGRVPDEVSVQELEGLLEELRED